MRKAYVQACVHMEFVAQLYHDQVLDNRYFLHGHPRHASSCELRCMERLKQTPEANVVHGDLCQYGAEAFHGSHKGWPMTPTGFVPNAPEAGYARRWAGTLASSAEPCCAGCRPSSRPRDDSWLVATACKWPMTRTSLRSRCTARFQGYSGRFKGYMTAQSLKDALGRVARTYEFEFFGKILV